MKHLKNFNYFARNSFLICLIYILVFISEKSQVFLDCNFLLKLKLFLLTVSKRDEGVYNLSHIVWSTYNILDWKQPSSGIRKWLRHFPPISWIIATTSSALERKCFTFETVSKNSNFGIARMNVCKKLYFVFTSTFA